MTGKHGAPTTTAAQGFGTALRAARDKQGISQETLAERANIGHSCVSRLESGSRNPSRETVVKLADALGLKAIKRILFFGEAGFIEQPLTFDAAFTLYWTTQGEAA